MPKAVHSIMKKIIFLVLFTLVGWQHAIAQSFVSGGLRYTVTSSTTVTNYGLSQALIGNLTIPAQVTYNSAVYSVTSIVANAYSGSSAIGITSISIPNSVTSIGDTAFVNCIGLTVVTLNNTTPISINATVFNNSNLSDLSLNVPAGTESLYKAALVWKDFYSISETGTGTVEAGQTFAVDDINYVVRKASLPYEVAVANTKTIVGAATIPSTVSNGGNSFAVTSIGNSGFKDCAGLTSINLPNSITSIGSGAFYNCKVLTSVPIPNSVTSIGQRAFLNCTGLTSITIPDTVTSIGDSAFSSCGLTSVVIPSSITNISNSAFFSCRGLTSVSIPNTITSIGDYAFSSCVLTSVSIPSSVTRIGNSAFQGCNNLRSVICNIVTPLSINPSTFLGVPLRTCSLIVPAESVAAYRAANFWKNFSPIICPNPSTTVTTFAQIAPICEGNVDTVLPTTSLEGVTGTWWPALDSNYTQNYTFTPTGELCASSLMTITVVKLETGQFEQYDPICAGTTLELPTTSLTGITGTWSPAFNNLATTKYAFTPDGAQCPNNYVTIVVNPPVTPTFTQVNPICIGETLPNLPTTSKEGITGTWFPALNNAETTTYTFTPDAGQCATAATLEIVVNAKSIPRGAVSVLITGSCIDASGIFTLNGTANGKNRYVQSNSGAYNILFDGTRWVMTDSSLFSVLFMNDNIPYDNSLPLNGWFPEFSSYNCSNGDGSMTITAPRNISVNGFTYEGVSQNTVSLVGAPYTVGHLAIPASVTTACGTYAVTSIGAGVFSDFNEMTSVTIPNSVTSIGAGAFEYCTGLTSLNIPDSVVRIGEFSFTGCERLTSLTIPNSVTIIAAAAFEVCYGLKSLNIPNSVVSIGEAAFAGCNGLTTLTIPNSVTSIGNRAFWECTSLTSVICNLTDPLGINANVFEDVNQGDCSLFVPTASVGAYQAADVWKDFYPIVCIPRENTTTISACGSYTWTHNNQTYTSTGVYTDTTTNCVTEILDVTITTRQTPTFTQVNSICFGETLDALPTTSNDEITGTWSPALNNEETTTYTFTPDAGQCATTASMTITVNPSVTPTFTAVATICSGETLTDLPTTSLEEITGTWSPSLDNTKTTAYTFTPDAGQCAANASMTIAVTTTPAPTGLSNQVFSGVATLADLSVDGIAIQWYDGASGGSALAVSTALVDGTTYYASQTVNSCESARIAVTAKADEIPSTMSFCSGAKVSAAVGTSTLKFYSALTGGVALAATTNLATRTYYATITINGIESTPRLAVAVTINTRPGTISTLTASDTVLCKYIGTTNTVTYTATPGASSYSWTVPAGVTIIGVDDTNVLTVDFHAATPSVAGNIGSIGVKAVNDSDCESATAKTIALSTKLPAAPSKATLSYNGVAQTRVGHFVGDATKTLVLEATDISNTATKYTWELPAGVGVVSGDPATDKIITIHLGGVVAGNTDLVFRAYSVAGCGTSLARSLVVKRTAPAAPTTLALTNDAIAPTTKITIVSAYTGKLNATALTLTATPSATSGATATSYKWVLPSGIGIVDASAAFVSENSGFTTYTSTSNAIKINLSAVGAATSWLLKVYGVNGNGESLLSKDLTLKSAIPAKPGRLTNASGSTATYHPSCATITVKVPNVFGVAYTWSIKNGALATIPSTNTDGNEATIDVSKLSSVLKSSFKIGVVASNGTGSSETIYTINLGPVCSSVLKKTDDDKTAKVTNEFKVIVYPNPSSNVFTIKIQSSTNANSELLVYDTAGRLMEQLQVQTKEMDLGSRYPAGIYNVIVKQGENVKTVRVLKK